MGFEKGFFFFDLCDIPRWDGLPSIERIRGDLSLAGIGKADGEMEQDAWDP